MPVLHASKFILRPLAAEDATSFAEAVRESGATVGRWMPWAKTDYTESDALAWFSACAESRATRTAYEFGIFDADGVRVLGGAGLNQINKVNNYCNLGYWVRDSSQRRGAATAAVHALKRYAFEELKLTRVEIVVAVANLPSLGVAHKCGAIHECVARNRLMVHGEPTDAHVFSLIP